MHERLHTPARRVLLALAAAAAFAALLTTPHARADEKVKPEELVARHLEAIGTAEARSRARTRVATGDTRIEVRAGGRGGSEGSGLIASDGDKVLLGASFNSPDYPFERIGFDAQLKAGSCVFSCVSVSPW